MDRVLQVIGGLNRAGAETMLMNLYRSIDREKVQFDFLIYKSEEQDYEKEIISLGGRIIRISVSGILSPLQYIKKIRCVMRQYGPYKAVHIHTLHNGAFALLAAKPFKDTVKVMHSHNTENRTSSILKKAYNGITKSIIRAYSDKCVACGQAAGEYLFGKKFSSRGIVLNNGIELSEYLRCSDGDIEALKAELGISENDLVIGCIGRLEDVKNHMFAVEIAKSLKKSQADFKLLIVGKGVLFDALTDKINDLGLSDCVALTGTRADIPQLLKTFDVFLMPSLFEGLPVTMIEAQAAGTPCLVSDVITDEADIGLGLISYLSLCEPSDVWAQKLEALRGKRITDTAAIEAAISEHGFDVRRNIQQLTDIYGI